MSDRINAITVVLDKEYRDDDCEAILTALRMVRGVLSVVPNVADPSSYIAEERARHDLRKRLTEVLWPSDNS